jgi:hypothetical protein
MYVKLYAGRRVTLEDRDNFRAFKLVVEGEAAQIDDARKALAGTAELEDAAVAWISQAALRARPEVAGDAAWTQGFDTMIEKAHIEWVPSA